MYSICELWTGEPKIPCVYYLFLHENADVRKGVIGVCFTTPYRHFHLTNEACTVNVLLVSYSAVLFESTNPHLLSS